MFHVISTFILLIHYPPKIVCTCDSPQQQREGELHLLVSAELLRQASWDNVQCHHYNVRILSTVCSVPPHLATPSTARTRGRPSAGSRPRRGRAARPRCTGRTCRPAVRGLKRRLYAQPSPTLRDLTMFSANSSAWLPAAAPGTLRSRDFPFAAADRDLAALLSAPGDLARLEDLAPRAIDLCGVSGSLRVVLQMRSRMPEPPPVT